MVEKKRITKKDWKNVEDFITDELSTREGSKARKRHSKIWEVVDRQVAMEPMSRVKRDPKAQADWRNAIELGELSRASEVITADVRRLTFPQTRSWFEAHIQAGEDVVQQKRLDGRLRAMMTQQHIDFGFKSRIDLSVKEALHHGSYVATCDWEHSIQVSGGTGVSSLAAPVWTPHSMWNCFPDPSAGANNTFYQGDMIIKSYKPLHQVKKMVSENTEYPFFNLSKIEKKTNKKENSDDTEDIELVWYYGDVVMPRQGQDILLLNSRAILANGKIIHYQPNPNPYPSIIYNGWERLDVRDPYYVSPLVKFSVNQTIGSVLANRLLDAVDLKTEPPVSYDGNDPDMQLNGGPDLSPGAKNASKYGAKVEVINVGDPGTALAGLQFVIQQIEAGTKVDRVRSGVSPGTEQTATEVIKTSQNSELSTIDFVDKHESHGLRPYLYMQNDYNRARLNDYKFYNQELDSPDFEVMKKSEIPKNVHFEIVGSKGLLDEERRQAQTSQVAAFWVKTNPQLLKMEELAMEMFRDAGNKNPERFLNVGDEADQMKQQMQQAIEQIQQAAQQQIQALSEELQKLDEQLSNETVKAQRFQIDNEQKDVEKAKKDVQIQSLIEQIKLIKADAAVAQMNEFSEALINMAGSMNAPKKVVYDEEGRPIGIEQERPDTNNL